MRSSRARRLLLTAALLCASASVRAQAREGQGFAVERYYPSAPGAGYFVMDTLSYGGTFAGTMGITLGHSHDPLKLPHDSAGAGQRGLSVVSERSFVELGFAGTYGRLRLHFNFEMPVLVKGNSGTIGGYTLTAPDVNLGSHPDLISDARFGADVRLLGAPDGPFRAGLGAQLFFPNGDRNDYMSDDTFRAIGRALIAGDLGRFSYAGQLGVHVRPLDEANVPGNPQGHELLFGLAAAARASLGPTTSLVIGPELFGETAFKSFLRAATTGVECLMGARLETPVNSERVLRIKAALGGGLHARFGAPEWRMLLALELTGAVH